jgi:hypothetical protein
MKQTAVIISIAVLLAAVPPAAADMSFSRQDAVEVPVVCVPLARSPWQGDAGGAGRIAVYREADGDGAAPRTGLGDELAIGLAGLVPLPGDETRNPRWDITDFLTGILNVQNVAVILNGSSR